VAERTPGEILLEMSVLQHALLRAVAESAVGPMRKTLGHSAQYLPPQAVSDHGARVLAALREAHEARGKLLDAAITESATLRQQAEHERKLASEAALEVQRLRAAGRAGWRFVATDPPPWNRDVMVEYADGDRMDAWMGNDEEWYARDRADGKDQNETPVWWYDVAHLPPPPVRAQDEAVHELAPEQIEAAQLAGLERASTSAIATGPCACSRRCLSEAAT